MAHHINNVSRLLLSLLLPVISVSQSFSQNTDSPASRLWTLRECTDYAVEHNHDIESNQLNVENAKIDVLTAKAARYPDVSASMGQSVSNNWFNSNIIY